MAAVSEGLRAAARRRLRRVARATGCDAWGYARPGVTPAARAVDVAASATVVATMAMEMVRYATWVWPAVLVAAEVSHFGIAHADVAFALSLPLLFVVVALGGVGVIIDGNGGPPRVLRAAGVLAVVEAALVFAAWLTAVWWPVLIGRALIGVAEAADPASSTIIARRVPRAWFGFVSALCVTAGTSGSAAVALLLPRLPPAAFPWLHLGMGATTAVLAWTAAALEEVSGARMRARERVRLRSRGVPCEMLGRSGCGYDLFAVGSSENAAQITAHRAAALLAAHSERPPRLHELHDARAHAVPERDPRHGAPHRAIFSRLRGLPRAYWAVVAANACAWSVYYAFEAMGPATFSVRVGRNLVDEIRGCGSR